MKRCRHLIVVLGDQLDAKAAVFDDFDKKQDIVWMAECAPESTYVWSHKARIVIFLSAMRHFRDSLAKKKYQVHYHELDDATRGLTDVLAEDVRSLHPEKIIMTFPGEWRVLDDFQQFAKKHKQQLEILPDRHFYSTPEEFAEHAKGRKQLRLEFFYRELRRKHDVLLDHGKPEGGKWNYDADNRGSFKKEGPSRLKASRRFKPDKLTSAVIELVNERFADHPGDLDEFDWPVTTKQAAQALDDFLQHRLGEFGQYQDAMWTDEPYLYHSRLSAAMNLKLIDPRDVVNSAVAAYRAGKAPLNSVEGFVRQILGWREYVRGVYWLYMPDYVERNALKAKQPLPSFYWDGDTNMHCLSQAIGQTLRYGYAHHIQRLMVTGLFSLLLGVDPKQVHEWYLAVYVDAIEWVELPNSLGMSQFADGGIMASKPYVATGKYIKRMSNYCKTCQFNPDLATGEDACPFTTLYWDFLERHKKNLKGNNRMTMQLKNLERKKPEDMKAIRKQAKTIRERLAK